MLPQILAIKLQTWLANLMLALLNTMAKMLPSELGYTHNNLKSIMADSGISVSTLADALGLSHATVYRWVNGSVTPRGYRWKIILQVCEKYRESKLQ
jgi:DNA-binding transcriptional regulator YiaG